VGFLGPNGAGKTTTMRMLTGTLQPDEGLVTFDGKPISEDLTAAKRRVGYLPEANPLYDDMLVAEYLEYVAQLRDLPKEKSRSAIADAVEETGTKEVFYRPIGELSKGFRQRVGMTAAILHGPEILILDEPTEGLDPNQRVDIRRLVVDLGRERTVLLSTHVMQEVEATCSRLLILRKGKLVAEGSVGALLAQREGTARYTAEIDGNGVAEALSSLPGVQRVDTAPVDGRLRVQLEAAADGELRPAIFGLARERSWTLWELHREHASLEQLFRELTREGGVATGDDAAEADGASASDAGGDVP
jgi:ABC-2 type transport system ATP-binding protein